VSFSYSNMRKIEFTVLAMTLRYLLMVEDERKVTKFVEKLTELIELSTFTVTVKKRGVTKTQQQFELGSMIVIMQIFATCNWGSPQFWTLAEKTIESGLKARIG